MKTSTAGDWHCCDVSQQKGEISPQREKSESHNTHSKHKEERVWSVLAHLSTASLSSEAEQGEKPSVTSLNNILPIFGLWCRQNDFASAVEREIHESAGLWGQSLKMAGKAVLEVLLQEAGSLGPRAV